MGKSRGLSQGQAMALAFDGSWLWPRFLQAKAGPGQAKPGRHITNFGVSAVTRDRQTIRNGTVGYI